MGGGDWQQLLQSIVLGLIFSYLLAKLISIVVSFKEDNLTITRAAAPEDPPDPNPARSDPVRSADSASLLHEADSVAAEHGSVRSSEVESDDDWEGVESTELDELFSAATTFVAAEKTKVSTEKQLQLYGLYKIATEGPCSVPQPSALKMTARAKW